MLAAIRRAFPARLKTAKPSARLHANGFALLPIEAGAIREAWLFTSPLMRARKKTPSPTKGIANFAALKRHKTVLRQVWFFELHC
jgi:hypothetical protein